MMQTKILRTKSRKTLENRKISEGPRLEKIIFVKTATLSKWIYRFNANPIKMPMIFITEKKPILKLIWKHQLSQ